MEVIPQGNISAKDLHADLQNQIKSTQDSGLFKMMSANQWLQQANARPIPKMLFGEFWFEGEICILFADTNLGKSILAVQIGNSISKGMSTLGFPLEAVKQKVLYFDFELSEKQFENRYSVKYQDHYFFDDGFLRVEINPDTNVPDERSFEDYLNDSLEGSIQKSKAKVLIIDNLTYLKNETEKAKDALPLMKHLKALKTKYSLSILALAHTPKRDLSKPINRNDLQGSKMLMSFCDSSFTIGESHTDKNLRYLKQIKARNTEIVYDGENVCTCQIEKASNFLQFVYVGFNTERDHLRPMSDSDKRGLEERIIELHGQDMSYRQIGKELNISHMTVQRLLKKCNNP